MYICKYVTYANVNIYLTEENVIQTKKGIMTHAVSVKPILYMKNIIFGILLHEVMKMIHI